ncbi:MAG: Lipid-A-disaccharide synthase [Chlamydiales bacterium]|nr:Lipid-A-disaccharide synthase [Chlamydiales bacterium]
MNIDLIRSFLYPLGLIANLLFGLRFLIQWLESEKKQKSTVTSLFWILSLSANCVLCFHAWIQLQYPVCLIQALNAIIAWRNLNLMGHHPSTKNKTVLLMGGAAVVISALFLTQGLIFHSLEWMRPPTMPWSGAQAAKASFLWHAAGLGGMVLFASRFWIQWWLAEKNKKSYLSSSFWWMSLIGGILSLIYFVRLADLVSILGYGLGLLPYIRNLMLIKKELPEPKEGLFLFAGEPSGDVLGGKLVEALRERNPALPISGVGGPLMRSAGMKITHPMERFQVMGFSAVLLALPRLARDFYAIRNQILKERPAGVVLIDYADFNMLLARSLRKKGYQGKLVHYVCPSVWAWRKKRIHSLAKTLDSLLSILPFEKECFQKTSLPVTYVGHPLVAAIDAYCYDQAYPLPKEKPILALFPGSRRHEIAHNLPLQWKAAQAFPDYTPVISVARPELMDEIGKHVDADAYFVPQEKRYELMRAARLALATSGTIVLEIGLHGVPTVTTYKLSTFNTILGGLIFRIRLPFYTLVNIICGREVFPEFIHQILSPEKIAGALRILDQNREACLQACQELRNRLLNQNASEKAAETIEALIKCHHAPATAEKSTPPVVNPTTKESLPPIQQH